MVLLAFSLQEQVEKYGAYVGIAAFFGLAVLTLLYFAQAREVKRLREWAGRAPERAAELEEAVAQHAEEVRRVPAPQPVAAQPAVVAEPVAATNGAVKLKPEEVAALAFARAAGVHEPHEPKPHPVPVAAAAVAAPPSQTVPAPVEPAPAATSVNGGGTPPAAAPPSPPPPATPAARRVDPLPPRRTAAPTRRSPAPPPPRRESSSRAVVLVAVIGVLVLAAAAFAVTQFGGDDPPVPPNEVAEPTAEPGSEQATATAEPGVTKEDALVIVYNATAVPRLAARYRDVLSEEGYPTGNLGTATLAEAQQTQTSTVMYARGNKSAAQDVADALGIEQVAQLDDAMQTSLASLPADQQKDWNVVAIIGQDKSS